MRDCRIPYYGEGCCFRDPECVLDAAIYRLRKI